MPAALNWRRDRARGANACFVHLVVHRVVVVVAAIAVESSTGTLSVPGPGRVTSVGGQGDGG